MKKNKAIILLSLVSLIMAFVLAMSFVKFTSGIKKYNSVIGAIDTDYDVSGGVSYTLTLNRENEKEVENVEDVLNVLDSRLNELGYKAYSLSAQKEVNDGVKDYSIRICVEDTDTVDSDIKAVSAYGTVKFFGGAPPSCNRRQNSIKFSRVFSFRAVVFSKKTRRCKSACRACNNRGSGQKLGIKTGGIHGHSGKKPERERCDCAGKRNLSLFS